MKNFKAYPNAAVYAINKNREEQQKREHETRIPSHETVQRERPELRKRRVDGTGN